jgi:hypothetical protein
LLAIGPMLASLVLGSLMTGVAVPDALAGPPGLASARAPVALMGLSLGMTARQVVALLRTQDRPGGHPGAHGPADRWRPVRLALHSHRCRAVPAASCPDLLRAETPDSRLLVRFAESPPGPAGGRALAWQISLTIDAATGAGTVPPPRGAAAAHGAPPARQLWCPGVAPGAPCPAEWPRLSMTRGEDGRTVLILTDPGLRDRLARRPGVVTPSAAAWWRRAAPPAG